MKAGDYLINFELIIEEGVYFKCLKQELPLKVFTGGDTFESCLLFKVYTLLLPPFKVFSYKIV